MSLNLFTAVAALQHFFLFCFLAELSPPNRLHHGSTLSFVLTCIVSTKLVQLLQTIALPAEDPHFSQWSYTPTRWSSSSSSGAPTAIKTSEEKRRPVKAQINLGQVSLCPLGVDGPHFEVCRLILDLLKHHSLESRGHYTKSYWPPAMFPHHCPSNRLFLFQSTIDKNNNNKKNQHIFLPF